MFTPQRKGWRSAAEQNGSLSWKGKAVASAGEITPPPPRPPPRNSLGENGGGGGGSAREAEVWRRFTDAGMLGDANFDKKDHEALLQRISKLEEELYSYQYNMGLLLLEKKEWTPKYEELQRSLIDAEEILKREQSAHLAAISEVEKREENLKKALGVEKQCIADLEAALREMRAKNSEMKFTSEGKLADANALIANIEDKSLEAAAKNSAADARLSELSRKSSEIERKLHDLTIQESMLQKERASLNIDKELHLKELSRKREELLAWETGLREGQERLVESQDLLNQRERRSNESDLNVKKKEKELDALRVEIERSFTSLKEREDYINLRLTALSDKEKEAYRVKESLEHKEKELAALKDALNEREKKITQEHTLIFDAKKREFDMNMEIKLKTFEEELQRKLVSVEKREREVSHREEELTERKCTLEKLITESNGAKMDLEVRLKSLKEREESFRRQNLEFEKKFKQFSDEEEELAISKARLEVEWKSLKSDKASILKQLEKLEISKEERLQHDKLQSQLKEEIEECNILKNLITKEREELRQERENFEREWEALDEKMNSLSLETKKINEEKERLEKWKQSEEERLENEQLATRSRINKELDELKLRKESFKGKMELERSEILEKVQQEREDMSRELETKKHELQIEMQKKLEESEHRFKLEVEDFNRMRETELAHINSLRHSASLDQQKLKCELDVFEREKLEYIRQRKKIEEAQLEIRNDIDSLRSLSRNMKNQREEFVREREHFLALVEKHKICQNCGVTIPELSIPFFQSQSEIEDPEKALLPSLAGGFMEGEFNSGMIQQSPVGNLPQPVTSSGRLSWLRSCTKKMFGFSPAEKNEESSNGKSDEPSSFNRVEPNEHSRYSSDNQRAGSDTQTRLTEDSGKDDKSIEMPCPSAGVEDNSIHIHGEALGNAFGNRAEPDELSRQMEASGKTDKPEDMPCPSAAVEDDSVHIQGAALDNVFGDREKEPAIAPVEILTEAPGLSEVSKGIPDPEPRKKGKGRYSKGKYLKRTKPVQAAVDKDGSEEIKNPHLKTNEGEENTSQTDLMVSGLEHKRRFAETLGSTATERDADVDAQSESISVGGRRKRRQVAAASAKEAGDKRYNLRRSTVAGGRAKGPTTRSQSTAASLSNSSAGEIKPAIESEQHSSKVVAEGDGVKEIHVVERIAAESTVEVNEFSVEKVDKIVEDEDVNGTEAATTSVAIEDDGFVSEDDEYDSEEDPVEKRLNASIGKKIWNFLTS